MELQVNRTDATVTISATRLKVYRTCGMQYYYRYVLEKDDRPQENKNIGALLGLAIHQTIEKIYTEGITNPRYYFQTVFESILNEWNTEGFYILGSEAASKTLLLGKKIIDATDWSAFKPRELEIQFSLPFFDGVEMTGFIDMICEQPDGSIWIVDHKSQSKTPSVNQLAHDPQFIIYAWAYRELYGALPDGVKYHALRSNKLIESGVLDDFERKLTALKKDVQAMVSQKEFARRSMDTTCTAYCAFYELCYGSKVTKNEYSLD